MNTFIAESHPFWSKAVLKSPTLSAFKPATSSVVRAPRSIWDEFSIPHVVASIEEYDYWERIEFRLASFAQLLEFVHTDAARFSPSGIVSIFCMFIGECMREADPSLPNRAARMLLDISSDWVVKDEMGEIVLSFGSGMWVKRSYGFRLECELTASLLCHNVDVSLLSAFSMLPSMSRDERFANEFDIDEMSLWSSLLQQRNSKCQISIDDMNKGVVDST